MKIVHIVGTGTIGEPLIGLLSRHKDKLGIDEVTFHKNTPLKHDITKVKQLIERGARLSTDKDKFDGFRELGVEPVLDREEAISRATVVIDCTPKGIGLQNKRDYYTQYAHKVNGFIAQGSEVGFGKMYARGIVDMDPKSKFVQVVSCNTHNIAALLKSFEFNHSMTVPGGILSGDFVCLRRANDISQDGGFIPGIEVGSHKDVEFGTHHARDAFNLLQSQFPYTKLYSSAIKSNTQYMHAVRFAITLDSINSARLETKKDVLGCLENNPYVALTDKKSTNSVFSFGRDYGLYGRILSQTVVVKSTVAITHDSQGNAIIVGMSFTPQDGNSLLSSIAATLFFLDPKTAEKRLSCYTPYIFQEI